MAILRSFNIGISGLKSMGQNMSIIGDNIANSQTTGFKASRGEFQDVLSLSLKGIDGGDQFGVGTKLAHIKPMFSQGDISRTDSYTDLAIHGDGFFTVKAKFGKGFTRDGSLHFNKKGELVNSDNYNVMGFPSDGNGKFINKLEPIKMSGSTIPAVNTSKVTFDMNLDSRAKIQEFDINDPDETSSFANSVTVYDNVGTARLLTVYYNKIGANQWQYHVTVDGSDAVDGEKGKMVEMATGKLIFSDEGQLAEEIVDENSFNFNLGAKPDQKIEFNFGESLAEDGDGSQAITQYGSFSSVNRHSQDGYSAATLTSLAFDDDGVLSAVYNNGQVKNVAQIAIAKFDNNEGLYKKGKNLFKESYSSGQATVGKPNEGGRGDILSKSLELSNVDIAHEFVGLMTSQRNFSANAKAVQTADQMLQEVLSLKR
ncbi:MAG: flagellar hook protein [Halobacteriovoraceae bacterium]|nr:flagellar hook protein [Halobacteriovoraceae bacterium]